MKIEKLDFNKLKITLYVEDLQMYNINIKKLTPDSPELHTFLCEMMKLVNSQTSFNPFEGQVIVEAAPSGDTLVLMLSKLDTPLPQIKRIKAVKKKSREYICTFADFDTLGEFFRVCGDFFRNAALYKSGVQYFLLCNAERIPPYAKEFCSVRSSSGVGRHYLDEHGKFIADGNELENIINFFKGEKTDV